MIKISWNVLFIVSKWLQIYSIVFNHPICIPQLYGRWESTEDFPYESEKRSFKTKDEEKSFAYVKDHFSYMCAREKGLVVNASPIRQGNFLSLSEKNSKKIISFFARLKVA